MAQSDSAGEARLLAKLAVCLTSDPSQARGDDPVLMIEHALEIAQKEGSEELEMRVLTYRSHIGPRRNHLTMRSRSLELARRLGDVRAELFALTDIYYESCSKRRPIAEQRSISDAVRLQT